MQTLETLAKAWDNGDAMRWIDIRHHGGDTWTIYLHDCRRASPSIVGPAIQVHHDGGLDACVAAAHQAIAQDEEATTPLIWS